MGYFWVSACAHHRCPKVDRIPSVDPRERLASDGQEERRDCDDHADGKAGENDRPGPRTIRRPRDRVDHILRLTELAEVEDPSRAEPGTEPEPRLVLARRRSSDRQDEDEPRPMWRVGGDESDEHDEADSKPDMACTAAPCDLGRTDVADARDVLDHAAGGHYGTAGGES
jgi:hypothetical protein